MKHVVILNSDGGTIKNLDVSQICELITTEFEAAGHVADLQQITGSELIGALKAASENPECEAILIAGGDGSVSAAAEQVWRSDKLLAILPVGTMNLFARSVGMPLDVEAAISAIANGRIHSFDLVTANGKPFLHQFSAGIQPEIVRRRDRQSHSSRIGKLLTGVFTYFKTLARPPRIKAELVIDGILSDEVVSFVCVTNNLYGKGHLPHADMPDQGTIGIYTAPVLSTEQYLKLTSDLFLGCWENNPNITERAARSVTLTIRKHRRKDMVTLDGELAPLELKTEFQLHPKSLKVIIPSEQEPR